MKMKEIYNLSKENRFSFLNKIFQDEIIFNKDLSTSWTSEILSFTR